MNFDVDDLWNIWLLLLSFYWLDARYFESTCTIDMICVFGGIWLKCFFSDSNITYDIPYTHHMLRECDTLDTMLMCTGPYVYCYVFSYRPDDNVHWLWIGKIKTIIYEWLIEFNLFSCTFTLCSIFTFKMKMQWSMAWLERGDNYWISIWSDVGQDSRTEWKFYFEFASIYSREFNNVCGCVNEVMSP